MLVWIHYRFQRGTRIPSLICSWISWRLHLFKRGLAEDTAHYHCSHPVPWKAVCSKDHPSSTPNGWGNTDFWEQLLVCSWWPRGGRKEGPSHTPCTTQSGRVKMEQGKQSMRSTKDRMGADHVPLGWESFLELWTSYAWTGPTHMWHTADISSIMWDKQGQNAVSPLNWEIVVQSISSNCDLTSLKSPQLLRQNPRCSEVTKVPWIFPCQVRLLNEQTWL